jgi:hypothetical protein
LENKYLEVAVDLLLRIAPELVVGLPKTMIVAFAVEIIQAV